jgi:hypothetical protein
MQIVCIAVRVVVVYWPDAIPPCIEEPAGKGVSHGVLVQVAGMSVGGISRDGGVIDSIHVGVGENALIGEDAEHATAEVVDGGGSLHVDRECNDAAHTLRCLLNFHTPQVRSDQYCTIVCVDHTEDGRVGQEGHAKEVVILLVGRHNIELHGDLHLIGGASRNDQPQDGLLRDV